MSDLIYRLRKRAEIRRQITTRKSVQNNEPDRIAELLNEAADRIAELEKFIKAILKKGGCDGNICKRYSTHPVKQLSDENLNTIREALLMIGFSDGFINYDLKEKALAIIKEITE